MNWGRQVSMIIPDAAYPDDGDSVKSRRLRQRLWLPLLAFCVLIVGVAGMAFRAMVSPVGEAEIRRVLKAKHAGPFPSLNELKLGQQVVLTWNNRGHSIERVWTFIVDGGQEIAATLLEADGRWVEMGVIMDPPHSVQRVRLSEEQMAGFLCLVRCLEQGRWSGVWNPAIVRVDLFQEGRLVDTREGLVPKRFPRFNPDQIGPEDELVAGLGRQRMKELDAFVRRLQEGGHSSGELE